MLNLKYKEIIWGLEHLFDDEKYVYAYDSDSSLRAWEYYFTVYKDLFKENYKSSKFWIQGRKYKRIIGTFFYSNFNEQRQWCLDKSPYLEVGKNIGIAGDCVFNFNEKK